ncbi:MAG: energy-coupling factor transporter ATPase [Clostridiales bacterium]|nr:energy-coupling factor transporter ATPase [Clostridiales bacterium]
MSIIIKKLTHIYMKSTPFESVALKDIDLEINRGEFIGIIGHTGSGKSTLIQHLNGLLKPTRGTILIDGEDIFHKDVDLRSLRQRVGLVFQYPEYQLFEETVYKDIAFGPKNLNLPEEEIYDRIKESMEVVGLSFDSMKDRSPFELSGGQRRRVAIAGVLAMKPEVLVLDEPAAGLDPRGRDEILGQIKRLHQRHGLTTILVSHSMDDIAKLVDRIVVMNEGTIALIGTPREVFREAELLEEIGLGLPSIAKLMRELKKRGMDVKEDIYTIEDAKEVILKLKKGGYDA